jgi:hypothetical protein
MVSMRTWTTPAAVVVFQNTRTEAMSLVLWALNLAPHIVFSAAIANTVAPAAPVKPVILSGPITHP